MPVWWSWPWGATASAWVVSAALLVAMLVDLGFGEPGARWHPVVWMGRYLGWCGRRIAPADDGRAPQADWPRFRAGAMAWSLGACGVALVAWALQAAVQALPGPVAALLLGLLLKPMLAWRMLQGEVLAVETALGESLDAGRAQLARLVSRDVARLSAGQVRESAIESLAENLNDSVVAPIFWFALFGLPGAAVYRFANTADAMWGYRGARQGRVWEWAGKWAARADDVLSWLPARLTGLLIRCMAGRLAANGPSLRSEAGRTTSPNSGWPMAAMALALGVRLSKPGVYALNAGGRAPVARDMPAAVALCARALVVHVLLSVLGMQLLSLMGVTWP